MKNLFASIIRTTSIRSLHRDERGLSTVEYVIILVLLAVVAIQVWTDFGDTIRGKIKDSDEKIGNMG
jgi:Flp pilus assembly pilin Flp